MATLTMLCRVGSQSIPSSSFQSSPWLVGYWAVDFTMNILSAAGGNKRKNVAAATIVQWNGKGKSATTRRRRYGPSVRLAYFQAKGIFLAVHCRRRKSSRFFGGLRDHIVCWLDGKKRGSKKDRVWSPLAMCTLSFLSLCIVMRPNPCLASVQSDTTTCWWWWCVEWRSNLFLPFPTSFLPST